MLIELLYKPVNQSRKQNTEIKWQQLLSSLNTKEKKNSSRWETVKNIYFVTVNEFVLVHEITKPNKYLQKHTQTQLA